MITKIPWQQAGFGGRSDLILKPDDSEWSQGLYTIVDKLRAKVVAGLRVRV